MSSKRYSSGRRKIMPEGWSEIKKEWWAIKVYIHMSKYEKCKNVYRYEQIIIIGKKEY